MDILKLEAESREARGTRAARRLRGEGKLPGIVYGHGEKPLPIAVPQRNLSYLLEQGAHLLELDLKGGAKQVLIKDVQFHPVDAHPIHVDFTLVNLSERVQVSVPLEFKGEPAGVKEGGSFDHALMDIEVDCVVTNIPESIRVVIDSLNIGDSLHVSDVTFPEGVVAVTPEDTIVCSVRAKVAAEVEEEEVEEGSDDTQPEIIGRKAKEDEADED